MKYFFKSVICTHTHSRMHKGQEIHLSKIPNNPVHKTKQTHSQSATLGVHDRIENKAYFWHFLTEMDRNATERLQ